jgi:hypothetical protein
MMLRLGPYGDGFGATPDGLTLQRLKKQKLALKDQIVRVQDQLIPDIIA